MRHLAAAVAAAALGVVVSMIACSGDGGGGGCSKNPTAPGCAPPKVTITASVDHLKTRDTFTFVGTAAHPDGTNVAVTQWSSDNTQVATVDSTSGKVTAVAPGTATIIADHDGAQATKKLHAVPDYQGRWEGDYAVTACTESGDFVGFCQDFPVNEVLPIMVQLTQTGDAAQGTMMLGELPATARGTVDDGAALPIADATIAVEGISILVSSTRFTMEGTDRLQGTFRTTWTYPGAAGRGQFDASLRTVSRTSTTVAPASMRQFAARTWRDLMPAFKRR